MQETHKSKTSLHPEVYKFLPPCVQDHKILHNVLVMLHTLAGNKKRMLMNEAHQLPSALALLAIQPLMRETAFLQQSVEDNRRHTRMGFSVSLRHTQSLTMTQSKHLLHVIIPTEMAFEGH